MKEKDPGALRVECYAGYKGEQHPVGFHLGKCRYHVDQILDRWYEPQDTFFKVQADDGNVYILRNCSDGTWRLESFRSRH